MNIYEYNDLDAALASERKLCRQQLMELRVEVARLTAENARLERFIAAIPPDMNTALNQLADLAARCEMADLERAQHAVDVAQFIAENESLKAQR